jgi:arylsulfatase A-like enzyme
LAWDGQNVWPVIAGQLVSPPARTLYWPHLKRNAVRHGDWKLIVANDGRAELFNLAADPNEKRDLASHEAARVQELRTELKAFQAADQKTIPADLQNVP